MAIGFYNSYSKAYGQIYIQDDHFFSLIAVVTGFANGICRIFWGKMFDMFGFQVNLIRLCIT